VGGCLTLPSEGLCDRVRERERVRERVCVCVRERERERERGNLRDVAAGLTIEASQVRVKVLHLVQLVQESL